MSAKDCGEDDVNLLDSSSDGRMQFLCELSRLLLQQRIALFIAHRQSSENVRAPARIKPNGSSDNGDRTAKKNEIADDFREFRMCWECNYSISEGVGHVLVS